MDIHWNQIWIKNYILLMSLDSGLRKGGAVKGRDHYPKCLSRSCGRWRKY